LWSFDHFDEFELTNSLWRTITNRLSFEACIDIPKLERYSNLFQPLPGRPLDGIIAYLSRRHGGNVHDKGIANVSASSIYGYTMAKNAVDLANHQQNFFHSLNSPDQWLCYDFKERRIQLTKYSIAAHTNGYCFLRSWIVEGSEDGSSWTVLDERKSSEEANSDHPIATFSVKSQSTSRFIRLRQTGQNSGDSDSLVLHGFEVFGWLLE
jgi:hypothetical protein